MGGLELGDAGFDVHAFAQGLMEDSAFQELSRDPVLLRSLVQECMASEDTSRGYGDSGDGGGGYGGSSDGGSGDGGGEGEEECEDAEYRREKARYEYARKLAVLVAAEAGSVTGSKRGGQQTDGDALRLPVLSPRGRRGGAAAQYAL
jgi:hypothetical protein